MSVSVQSPSAQLRFGKFQLDPASGELHQNGHKIPLAPKAFELLRVLVERPGLVVTREELRAKLWAADTFVEFDDSLNHTVKKLRMALGDSAENPQFIETLPRFGYRFIAKVETPCTPEPPEPAMPAPSRRTVSRQFVLGAALLSLLVALLASDVGDWRSRLFSRASSPPIRSLAVLPLANLSGDPQQDYFADGMTDALITDLAKIHSIKVISRTSVMQFKNAQKPLPEIGHALGVDGILEGSLQRSGEHVRITVQLIRAQTDAHLWSESYERNLRDVLTLQGEIAQDVARQIKVTLTPEESTHLTYSRTLNPQAYELYLMGRYERDRLSPEGEKKSLEYYEQAINLEPSYAPAHSGIADAYTTQAILCYLPGAEVYPKAKAAALKALQLDPSSAEAHASLGFVYFTYEREYEAAFKEFETAVNLNPSYVIARDYYALSLAWAGRNDEAIREIEQALELDPLSSLINTDIVYLFFLGRQYDRAIATAQRTLELEPNDAWGRSYLARTYLQKGMFKEALAEFQRRLNLQPTFPKAQADMALAYAAVGNRKEALTILDDLERRSKREYVPAYPMARAYVGLGQKGKAFEWLEKGVGEYDGDIVQIKVDPAFDSLHSDPRFQVLLRRMNFPQ